MIVEWSRSLPWNIIASKAADFNLDPLLVASIIWQESKGQIYATRFEPKYKWLYEVDKFTHYLNSRATEVALQSCSYGLMQIMGAVVRELGYTDYLAKIYRPDINIYYGCMYLDKLRKRWPDRRDFVAAYNGGSPRKINGKLEDDLQDYVDSVLKYYHDLL